MRILLHKSNFAGSISAPAVTGPVWSEWRPNAPAETGSRPASVASDLPAKAAPLLKSVCWCWSIDNVHYRVMDTVFRQDDSRIRTGMPPPTWSSSSASLNTRRSGQRSLFTVRDPIPHQTDGQYAGTRSRPASLPNLPTWGTPGACLAYWPCRHKPSSRQERT